MPPTEPLLATATWIEPHEPVVPPSGERPAYLLRGRFTASGRVRVLATAHGVYELFVNGKLVGDEELTPGFTAYRTRLAVQEYDVSDLVRPGTNAIGVVLSDGWFRGRHGFVRRADGFGDRVAALVAVVADDEVVATSDASWCSRPSWITRADLMDGQHVDLRRYDPAWCDPADSDDGWQAVRAIGRETGDRLVRATAPPVRRIEELAPIAITRPGRIHVVDFGQNISGWTRLTRLGADGTRVTLTHGEAIDADGLVTTENLRAFDFATGTPLPAGQVDVVVSAGRDGDVFEPRHTTHGFRYVQVDGLDELEEADIRAVVVHTDLERVGAFRCSDPRLERLHEVVEWSLRGNACAIPTDCPQRERSGFTGDWQIFVETATRLYDVRAFTEDWLASVEADQWHDGRIPTVSPNPAGAGPSGNAFEDLAVGSAGWGDAAVFVPWQLFRAYGDPGILSRWLPMMRRWVEYASSRAAGLRHPDRVAAHPDPAPHERYLWDVGFHFGEWLEPGAPPAPDPGRDYGVVATAYLRRSAHLLARAASIVGDDDTATWAARIAAGARNAWRTEYLVEGRLAVETQADYARALTFGLLDPAERAVAGRRLAHLVADADGHLTTGFLGTALLLPALADAGQTGAAYDVLLSTGFPSWLGMLDRGATTIWEWWDGIADDGTARGSLNHYSKGAVVSFLHSHLVGLRVPDEPDAGTAGFRQVEIAPRPGGGITSAGATLDTPAGRFVVDWRRTGDRLVVEVDIPAGVEATLVAPDGARTPLGAGRARVEVAA